MRQADIDDGIKDGQTSTEQTELVQLRRDRRRLENEILRRATTYFAQSSLPNELPAGP
jgi:transposase